MTPQEAQLANLIKLAKADGQLHAQEERLVFGIAEAMGFSREQVDRVIERSDDWSTAPPPDEQGRIRYMYQLLILASADREVSQEEVDLLMKVGGDLGLDQQRLQQAIDHVRKNKQTDLSAGEVESILGFQPD